MGAPERRSDPKFHIALIHPETGLACPVPPNGWSRAPETLKELIDQNLIVFGKDHTTQPQKVVFLRVDGKKQVTSVISDGKSGKSYLDELNLEFPYCHPVSLYEQLLSTRTEKSIFMDFFAGSGTNGHAVLNLSREHNVKHHQILVEVGSHFDDVLVPRMKKLAFSSTWSSGFPDAETGDLQIYKIVKLESYEDSLNNLTIRRLDQQKSLLDNNRSLSESFKINYMLDFDSRSSIINTTDFLNPFEYRMNISTDSSGAYRSQEIDLIETFNFLIGIAVKHYEYNIDQGYVRIEGLLPSGEKALILWRDCEKVDYEKLREWENRLNIGAKDNPYDVIYINGDHNLSEIYSPTKKEGGETSVRVIRSIEPEFLSRMFAEEEI